MHFLLASSCGKRPAAETDKPPVAWSSTWLVHQNQIGLLNIEVSTCCTSTAFLFTVLTTFWRLIVAAHTYIMAIHMVWNNNCSFDTHTSSFCLHLQNCSSPSVWVKRVKNMYETILFSKKFRMALLWNHFHHSKAKLVAIEVIFCHMKFADFCRPITPKWLHIKNLKSGFREWLMWCNTMLLLFF